MKVALVTGGSSGFGYDICQRLAAIGYKVGILDIEEKEGTDLSISLNKKYGAENTFFNKCDVADEESFKKSFETAINKWGKVDLLVNNAGLWNDSPQGWRRSVDVNVNGTIAGSLLAIQYMGKDRGGLGGTVINISSVMAFTLHPLLPIYSATKAAVLQFTRNMSTDAQYQLHGVNFIAVCPHGALGSKFLNEPEKKFIFTDENFIQLFYKMDFNTFQKVDNVGKGIMEVLEKADNGSVWIIEDESGARKIDIPKIDVKKF